MKVLTIIANRFEDLELIGTVALLRRAGINVDIATINKDKTATGNYLTKLDNLLYLNYVDYKKYDMVFLPGGPEWVEISQSDKVIEIIKYFMDNNLYFAAICAAPTILGKFGYLKNKKYTCFTSMNEDFQGTFIDQYCVRDNNLVTGRSPAAVIDFALLIIETLLGSKVAENIKQNIYYYK